MRRRDLVAILVLSVLVLSALASPPAAAHPLPEPVTNPELCLLDTRQPDPSDPLYTGSDPSSRQLSAYNPFRIIKQPCPRPIEERAIFLQEGGLELIAGGELVRRIPFPPTGAPVPFERVVEAVDDAGWAAEVEPGVFELSAAFVHGQGTSVVVAAPRINVLRLLNRPSVFLGGLGATARFEGVRVTSWDPALGAPDEELGDGRPFVLYQEGSRLDVVDSEMSFLGSDRSSAYGVAWRVGTTGEVLGSTFAHNFFGVYTFEVADIVFRDNVFRDNVLYGFDPHDYTTGLVVEDNEAYGNGSHGFIVSRYVTDSVLARNHAHDNAGNGIVMDFGSDRNRIEANLVENNAKDGIVVLGSAETVVVDNVVRGNRVGVRINGVESSANVVEGNLVEGNQVGLQAYGGASDLVATDNTILASSEVGMVLEAPRAQVRGGEIRGAPRGIGIRTATQVSGVSISDVDEGVVVGATGIADLDQLDISARDKALRLEDGGLVDLQGSTLSPAPPLDTEAPDDGSWLPLAGVAAIAVALVLELIRWRRERHDKPGPAPTQVWNRA